MILPPVDNFVETKENDIQVLNSCLLIDGVPTGSMDSVEINIFSKTLEKP